MPLWGLRGVCVKVRVDGLGLDGVGRWGIDDIAHPLHRPTYLLLAVEGGGLELDDAVEGDGHVGGLRAGQAHVEGVDDAQDALCVWGWGGSECVCVWRFWWWWWGGEG